MKIISVFQYLCVFDVQNQVFETVCINVFYVISMNCS